MAFTSNTAGTKTTFFKVKDGKFETSVKEGTPQVESAFEGTLKYLNTREVGVGKQSFEVLEAGFVDEAGDNFKLSLSIDSGYSITFLAALENADLSKPILLTPSITQNGQYTNYYMGVRQDGANVKMFYSGKPGSEHPIPKLEWAKVGKNNVKDNTKLVEFINQLVDGYNAKMGSKRPEPYVPQNPATAQPKSAAPAANKGFGGAKKEAIPAAPVDEPQDTDDDLPF